LFTTHSLCEIASGKRNDKRNDQAKRQSDMALDLLFEEKERRDYNRVNPNLSHRRHPQVVKPLAGPK
jgi:hypothetical protein